MIAVGGLILRALIHDLILSKHRGTGRFISKGGFKLRVHIQYYPIGVCNVPCVAGAELTVNVCTLLG